MKRFLILVLSVLLLLWLAGTTLIFVDATECVYVTMFGKHVATYDGATDPGLRFKAPWPIQSALRFDRRLQIFDAPTQELLISDKDEKTGEPKSLPLTFDVYVCWRIAQKAEDFDSVDAFVRSFRTLDAAESFLRSQIISRLKIELSDVPLSALVNTDSTKLKAEAMLRQVRDRPYSTQHSALSTQDSARGDTDGASLFQRARQVGIEIVDIRLRRFNHPVQVRDEIFAKIREDRRREANNYRLQGEELAAAIRAEGELEAKRIRTHADAHKVRVEGAARAEATRILNNAHKEAPEFYRVVRTLESYKRMFADDKTQLILSLDHPLLALLKDLPRLNHNAGNNANSPKR